jgi:hypothetical protein
MMIPSLFKVWSPDEVAECLEGVTEVPGLYTALWGLVWHYDDQPRSEVPDDFARRALANWWLELSMDHRLALRILAVAHDKREGLC